MRPFKRPFGALMAPMAGIAVVSLGIAVGYGILGLPFSTAATLTVAGATALTIASALMPSADEPRPSTQFCLLLTLAIAVLSVSVHCAATIKAGSPAIWAGGGTDQMNYAQTADWMRAHRTKELLTPSTAYYEDVPRNLVETEPRFGAFSFLAFVSLLVQRPAVFSYELVTAVGWTAFVLGVAGAIAQRRPTLLVLVVGLAFSSAIDLARGGYLGKILSYPMAVLIAALLMLGPTTPLCMLILSSLAVAAGALHYGIATAFLIAILCVPYLLALAAAHDRHSLTDRTIAVGFALLVAVASSGAFARVWSGMYPAYVLPWSALLPVALDIQPQWQWQILSAWAGADLVVAVVAVLLWTALLATAIRHKTVPAIGFLAGPLVLLAALMTANAIHATLQFVTIFYVTALCGGIMVLDSAVAAERSVRSTIVLAALIVVFVIIRAPRAVLIAHSMSWHAWEIYIFSQEMADRIEVEARGKSITVDTADPHFATFARAELLRRFGPNLYWSARAIAVAGNPRPLPQPSRNSDFTIGHPSDAVASGAAPPSRTLSIIPKK